MMRTLLSQFCDEFEARVRPVLDPLKRATGTLDAASTAFSTRQILPGLQEKQHQLQVLADKVAAQQAYVLIFGPLKSGKSTLMNAMTGAYVSEVTSLPAYPCLVFLSHAESREFIVTRFNGDQEKLTDPAALRMLMTRAHKELAVKIREVEESGELFDAGAHFPEAIRRIDVRVPAGELEESGAVLVDTPGLYSRMKIGYDRMTRSFRDTAACAVFVVKSDNLFLDHVFEEFNQLLSLFSRIFLVVNLDSSKQDLRPDGTLTPSLESKDPFRIIEAFENLSMNAPLKQAADEGRLRIYPVDLLRAASRRIQEGLGRTHDESDANMPGEADFDNFVTDLTDYLNSTDYLVAFLGDSIKHADTVMTDLKGLVSHTSVEELRNQVEEVQAETMRVHNQGEILARLSSFTWQNAFQELHNQLMGAVRDESGTTHERTSYAMAGALDTWFEGVTSLKTLTENELAPQLTTCQRDIARSAETELRKLATTGQAGMSVPAEVAKDLASAGIRLDAIARIALEKIDPYRGVVADVPPLPADDIPVKRSFLDWLMFRSPGKVRRKLFGHPIPSHRLPKAMKAKRLGPAARNTMLNLLESHMDTFFPHALDRLTGDVFVDYADAVVAALQEDLQTKKEANAQRRSYLDQKLAELGRIRADIANLETAVDRTLGDMDDLKKRYHQTPAVELGGLTPREIEIEETEQSETLATMVVKAASADSDGDTPAEEPASS